MSIPTPGTKVAAALDNISSFGIPGVNQSFSTSQITFAADGRFVSAGQVSGTTGGGSDFETNYVGIGADRKGTYAFEPGGTLAQFYEDGRVVRRSAFLSWADKGKQPSIAGSGLLLNGSPYLPDDD